MSFKLMLLVTLALAPGTEAAEQRMNPIRKVVSLLQVMQKKVTEEGEREEGLFKKYMCYCTSNRGALGDGIAAGEEKVEALTSDIKKAEEEKVATQEALEQAQNDRAAAKTAIAEATGIREKEAAAYAEVKASADANLFAILGRCNVAKPGGEYDRKNCATMGGKWVGALDALEKGMAGAFLQTGAAQVLMKLAHSKQDMLDADREDLLSFLSGTSEYAPGSGEIVGILKQMADEMGAALAEATTGEEEAIKSYEALMAAKNKEVEALTASIEKKLTKIGELSVSIAQMKNELGDTAEAIIADKEFLANLEKNCKTKKAEWAVIVKTRAEELTALAETIKVLNDDDALELFKKTLPSAASSFMQLQQGTGSMRARALAALKSVRTPTIRIDLIGLAIRGKKIGFEKVIGMIDEMVTTLKQEQSDDDDKKEYCAAQFDKSDDKKKGLEKSLSDTEAAIASTEEGIATLAEEIAALTKSIHDLDKSVAEATEQRKEEHEDYKELMASDSAAKELLGFAKNRLNKFYNPKLYKAPAPVELSKEDRILVNEGGTPPPAAAAGGIAGTGITVLSQVAPPPPPEAPGAYKKKSGENSGVLAMIDLLVQDLDKEMNESTAAEKDAQADYEQLMADSAKKRTSDSALLTEKTATKASMEGDLEAHKESHASLTKDLGATLQYIANLHAECDWLLKFFELRKTSRASEIDALGKAKAVLSGADYSLVQMRSRKFLRGSAYAHSLRPWIGVATPESEGLFSAAILQSGSVHMGFLSMDHYKPLSHFHRQYAQKVGCDTAESDTRSIAECLRKLDVEELYSAFFMFEQCNFLPSGGMANPATWKPINDATFSRDPFFKGGDPKRAMKSGRVANVPVMVGFTKDEGLINTVRLFKDPERAEMANNDPERCMAQNTLGVVRETCDELSETEMREAIKLYFGGDKKGGEFDFGGEDFVAVTDFFTDNGIAFASDLTKRSLVKSGKKNKIFYYRFDHLGSLSVADVLESSTMDLLKIVGSRVLGNVNASHGLGVSHADDLFYLFKPNLLPLNVLGTEEDEAMSRFMVDLWANFATFHNPTPKGSDGNFIGDSLFDMKKPWKPSKAGQKDGEDMAILSGATISYAKSEQFFSRIKFWEKMFGKLGLV